MKITEVKFGRKFNTGNYESEEYVVTALVDEDESVSNVFTTLKQEVEAAHSGQQITTTDKAEEDEVDEDPVASKSTKAKSKSAKGDDSADAEEIGGEEEEEDEAEVEEADEEEAGNDESEDEEKSKKQSKKSAPSTDGSQAGKAKTKFKKKPQVYQRANETHKEIFSTVLKAVAPNWKKDEKSKVKAKNASTKLEGEEFLDEDGNVMDSFKKAIKKHMGVK